MSANIETTLGARLLHRSMRVAARSFGGAWGQPLPDPPVLPEEHYLALGTHRLHLLRWPGSGPPLLLVHGLNNTAWIWARVASAMAADREVVSVTQRGHGASGLPEGGGYGLEETTGDLRAVLDCLGWCRADVAGHSWGGKAATHLAITAPDRVRSLFLADPAPPGGLNGVIRGWRGAVTAAYAPERAVYADDAAWQAGGRALIWLRWGDAVDARAWAAMYPRGADGQRVPALSPDGFQAIFDGPLAEDLTPLLPRLRCPVTVARATFTVSFLPGEWRAFWQAVPKARHLRIPGDHAFVATNPVDTVAALRRALA